MKEDKFCLSKSVAFIAVVVFILVGVVVFTNYMNSQNNATSSRAATEGLGSLIPVADRKITCPAPPALKRIWRETTNPATYFKDSGVCAAISNFEKAK